MKVGVFVDEQLQSLLTIASEANLTAVQLHGDETPEYCEHLKQTFVIKAFGARHDLDVSAYKVDAIMLDTKDDLLRGGTGRVFDWTVAQGVRNSVTKLFLAGGLSPENVAAAIATVRPYAVDACSSLEHSPGKKNHTRMRAFVNAVRNVRLDAE